MKADPLALAIMMIAFFALVTAGIYSIGKRNEKKQGLLMLVAAVVVFGNVLIWTWP